MTRHERLTIIETVLKERFSPSLLEVQDDSDQHIGHAGAEGGAGHYTVIISADELKGITRVAAHRKIYAALQHLMPHEIHALRIVIS